MCVCVCACVSVTISTKTVPNSTFALQKMLDLSLQHICSTKDATI